MSSPLKLAIFDCDGTLVDSQLAIVTATLAAWNAAGLVPPEPVAIRRMVGLPLTTAIERLLQLGGQGREDAGTAERLTDLFKQAFQAERLRSDYEEPPLFPGTLQALAALEAAGVLLGIATGKSRRGLDHTLAAHGIDQKRFITLQTADIGPGKPHPAMLLRALDESGIQAADAVMIGDTTYDITMARAANMRALAVSWGYHAPAELMIAGADRLVNIMAEVPPAVAAVLEAA